MIECIDCDKLQEEINKLNKQINILREDKLFYMTALNLSGKRETLEKLAYDKINKLGRLKALTESRTVK